MLGHLTFLFLFFCCRSCVCFEIRESGLGHAEGFRNPKYNLDLKPNQDMAKAKDTTEATAKANP